MKRCDAEARAKELFGPGGYAVKIERLANGYVFKAPYRIGVEYDGVREPLGAGLKWKEALRKARKCELGRKFRRTHGDRSDGGSGQSESKNAAKGRLRMDSGPSEPIKRRRLRIDEE